jgi:hypothetical protein
MRGVSGSCGQPLGCRWLLRPRDAGAEQGWTRTTASGLCDSLCELCAEQSYPGRGLRGSGSPAAWPRIATSCAWFSSGRARFTRRRGGCAAVRQRGSSGTRLSQRRVVTACAAGSGGTSGHPTLGWCAVVGLAMRDHERERRRVSRVQLSWGKSAGMPATATRPYEMRYLFFDSISWTEAGKPFVFEPRSLFAASGPSASR